MKQGIEMLKKVSGQVFCKNYQNSMTMIHSQSYSVDNLYKKIFLPEVKNNKQIKAFSINDLSKLFNIKSVGVCKMIIDEMIIQGYLCIDESDIDIRYYYNYFMSR